MKPIQQTIRFSIEADGQIQTGITQEVTLEWRGGQYNCWSRTGDYYCKGEGPSQTAAILDWLAYRIGAK